MGILSQKQIDKAKRAFDKGLEGLSKLDGVKNVQGRLDVKELTSEIKVEVEGRILNVRDPAVIVSRVRALR